MQKKINIPYFFYPLAYFLKTFFRNPVTAIYEFALDLKKDTSHNGKGQIVWVVGLPKSGTTLVEQILNETEYVQGNKSVLRAFQSHHLDHEHGICHGHFKYFPKNKNTFIKTHSHFYKKYLQIALLYNVKIIVIVRDLRDMMISRYYHILSDKNHWMFSKINALPLLQGFKKSCLDVETASSETPLIYYARWIMGWLKNYKKANACLLWYESYQENPISFINQILKFTNSNRDAAQIEKVISKQRRKLKSISSIQERRKLSGRNSSTFRKGGSSWKKFFDKPTNAWFLAKTKKFKHIYFNTKA